MSGDGEEDGECGVEYGKRGIVRKGDPRLPSGEARREHELTHIPFRSWCRHCVRGRGKEEMCRKGDGREVEIPELHFDYMFMGEEEGGKTLAVLVGKERTTKATFSTVVPRKSTGEWIVKRIGAWMREIGVQFTDISVKSDNEPALVSLIDAIGRDRAARGGGRMVVEHSPVFSSKSNGFVERAVQSVQGVVRTLRSALESRWGVRLSVDHGIWTWITEYAGWLLTRFQVGSDGKTAYERVKGKPARVQGFEFGEGVLWKRKRGGGPLGKLTCMWEDGVFLGVKGSTAELIVGDRRGIFLTRTMRRKPEEERWSADNLELVSGIPWRTGPEEEGYGEAMRLDLETLDKDYNVRSDARDELPAPRRIYISREDLRQYGYTKACLGCISVLKNLPRQNHIEGCRKRLEKELAGTDRMKAVAGRRDEYMRKVLERDEQRRREDEEKKRKRKLEEEEGTVAGPSGKMARDDTVRADLESSSPGAASSGLDETMRGNVGEPRGRKRQQEEE